MTQHVDDLLAAWLSEGPEYGSPAALDGALERTRSVGQRPGWMLGRPGFVARSPGQIGQLRFAWAVVTATGVVAAMIGFSVMALNAPGHVPRPAPVVTPSPSPPPSWRALYNSTPLQLKAGTYVVNHVYAGRATITVPSGWTGLKSGPGQALLLKTKDGGEFGSVSNTAFLFISAIKDVYTDPCRDTAPASPAPSSVDDLVTALTHQVGFLAGTVSDSTIGGVPAKLFEVHVGTNLGRCPNAPLKDWRYTAIPGEYVTDWGPENGAYNRVWIVDVKGTRLMILAESLPDSPRADVNELYQIAASIRFE
jgi:hypothetical protein